MQDFTIDMCNNLVLDKQYYLTDKRDEKIYTIARLKMNPDGTETKCWMTQNLALELSTSKTLTNEDTDLNSVTSWTPIRNTSADSSGFINDVHSPYSYNAGGIVYYNFTAAVASNDSSSLHTQYQNAPDSICPKGWRLPLSYSQTEFTNLLYAYGLISTNSWSGQNTISWARNGYTKAQQLPLNLDVDSNGYFQIYTSTVSYGNYVFKASFDSSNFKPENNYYLAGRAGASKIRCLLR